MNIADVRAFTPALGCPAPRAAGTSDGVDRGSLVVTCSGAGKWQGVRADANWWVTGSDQSATAAAYPTGPWRPSCPAERKAGGVRPAPWYNF